MKRHSTESTAGNLPAVLLHFFKLFTDIFSYFGYKLFHRGHSVWEQLILEIRHPITPLSGALYLCINQKIVENYQKIAKNILTSIPQWGIIILSGGESKSSRKGGKLMDTKTKEALQELLKILSECPEVAERITITIKPNSKPKQ